MVIFEHLCDAISHTVLTVSEKRALLASRAQDGVSNRIPARLTSCCGAGLKGPATSDEILERGNQSPEFRVERCSVMDGAQAAGCRTPRFLTFKQALELGGHVRKGERGTKVHFFKQLEIREYAEDDASTRLVPMLRGYTVFNVDQGANTFPIPSSRVNRCAFAIQIPAMSLPTISCIQPVQI